jgi:hypothetical protein
MQRTSHHKEMFSFLLLSKICEYNYEYKLTRELRDIITYFGAVPLPKIKDQKNSAKIFLTLYNTSNSIIFNPIWGLVTRLSQQATDYQLFKKDSAPRSWFRHSHYVIWSSHFYLLR